MKQFNKNCLLIICLLIIIATQIYLAKQENLESETNLPECSYNDKKKCIELAEIGEPFNIIKEDGTKLVLNKELIIQMKLQEGYIKEKDQINVEDPDSL